jgi:hypothetical protein
MPRVATHKLEGWSNLNYTPALNVYRFNVQIPFGVSGVMKTFALVSKEIELKSNTGKLALPPIIYIYRKWASITGRLEPKPDEDIRVSEDISRLVDIINEVTRESFDFMKLFESGIALSLLLYRLLNEQEQAEIKKMTDLMLSYVLNKDMSIEKFREYFNDMRKLMSVDSPSVPEEAKLGTEMPKPKPGDDGGNDGASNTGLYGVFGNVIREIARKS